MIAMNPDVSAHRVTLTSSEPFKRLVRLVARAFYDDVTTKGDNQPKTGRSDNRGIAVVVLDALTRRQWVKEEDLAKDLKLHSKQLRRTLRFFEEEKLVTRDQRKETAKGAKFHSAAVAATGDGQQIVKEGEEKIKQHMHSYCCLDYAQIYDVVRYRIHRMKKKLKDELDNRNTIQEYICPNCKRRYSALDALRLISPNDEYFHCENCNAELVAENDNLAVDEIAEGDDNARRRRREKLKDMLQKIEVQLKPLMDQLTRVKELQAPYFGTLQEWQARAIAAGRVINGDSTVDPSRSSQPHAHGGTPMPFVGETSVEVSLSGVEVKEEDSKPAVAATAMKALPPWMIKQGMQLTKEQQGLVKQETKMDGLTSSNGSTEDKKPGNQEKEATQNLQEEYLKAYYSALLERQKAAAVAAAAAAAATNASTLGTSTTVSEPTSQRQVGMKAKREDDGDEDIEWEESESPGNVNEVRKVQDLNAVAEESGEDEDDIDWEEG
ncbi:uncharacterized protein LOC116265952 [Nymphaea colorata]|nr:uncharacterized protein LOC116265952 [Nymphaea colorata]